MSNYCGIIWPEKFNGNEKNLNSFLIQFEIACQINPWEDHKKPFWFIQCIEGPASIAIPRGDRSCFQS